MNLKDIILYVTVLIIYIIMVIVSINIKDYLILIFFLPLLIIWCLGSIAI